MWHGRAPQPGWQDGPHASLARAGGWSEKDAAAERLPQRRGGAAQPTAPGPWQGVAAPVPGPQGLGPPRARQARPAAQAFAEPTVEDNLRYSLAVAVPRPADAAQLQRCMVELWSVVRWLGSEWRVSQFGSAGNHFLTCSSDLDVTVYTVDGQREGIPALAAQDLEQRVVPLLQGSGLFELREVIANARVPVLKLRFDGVLDVDLTCHNTEAMRNTQLLRAYAELHPAVRDVVLLVKQWAKAAQVCGAHESNLSSYALTLMVVYFFQVHPELQLPCLPTHAFTGLGDVPPEARVPWSLDASLGLAGVLHRFFQFFGSEFRWGTEVVSVRMGQRSSRDSWEHAALKGAHLSRFHVEDPFLLERNLNCVLGAEQEAALHGAIQRADADMRRGGAPAGLAAPRAGPPPPLHAKGGGVASENESTGPGSDSCGSWSDREPPGGGPAVPGPAAGGRALASPRAPSAQEVPRPSFARALAL